MTNRPITVTANNGTLDISAGANANNAGNGITGPGTLTIQGGTLSRPIFRTRWTGYRRRHLYRPGWTQHEPRELRRNVEPNTGNGAILNLNNNDLVYNYGNPGNPTASDPQKSQDIRNLLQAGIQ